MIKIKLEKEEINIIIECLANIWNCCNDEEYYEKNSKNENIRKLLIDKLEKKV